MRNEGIDQERGVEWIRRWPARSLTWRAEEMAKVDVAAGLCL